MGGRTVRAARVVGTLLLAVGVLAACTPTLQAVPVDPNVDFAAHVAHRGLVVDEMPGAAPAVLAPAGWRSWFGGPRFLLHAQDKMIAALWFPSPGRMIVRQTADPQSPVIGEINATWDHGAIRLMFKPVDGPVFETGTFDRVDGRVSTAALSSQSKTEFGLRGVYRAELRDANGTPVGWLRAQIRSPLTATRIYDGVIPASMNGALAAAAVALLDADVDYIENHAVNPYMGN